MKEYVTSQIRNIAVVGHLGAGKTSVVESLLYVSGAIKEKGDVDKGNTTSDYLKEEKDKQSSFSMSNNPVEWKNYKLNFLDIPGGDEFVGDLNQALRVVKGAVIVIDATKGVEVGTERVWHEIRKRHIPAILFVNKMDQRNINFELLLEEIREKLGKKAAPLSWPVGKDEGFDGFVDVIRNKAIIYEGTSSKEEEVWDDNKQAVNDLREMIMESVAETSEEYLDLYFDTGTIPEDKLKKGLRVGIMDGELTPVLVGSATKTVGIKSMLDMLIDYLPAPNELAPLKGTNINTKKIETRTTIDEEPFSGYIFKTIVNPYVGIINMVKINSGTLSLNEEVLVTNKNTTKKVSFLFALRGQEQIEQQVFHAGDICAVAKLDLETGDTIADIKSPIMYKPVTKTEPVFYMAIHPKDRKDEDKISSSLQRLNIEDPTFTIRRNKETAQLLLGGQGMAHINYIITRLENMFKVNVEIDEPKIVYRETIKKVVDGEGRHKKQSGGAGQFGHVFIKFEPSKEEFEFHTKVVGGAVPKNYIPAVEKGLLETFEKGPLAGFPVINIKSTLYDGSYHPVDSNEISFKLAASLAFKDAVPKAEATILEPIIKLEIKVKDNYVGDVMGDLNKRRGRILGLEQISGYQLITAEAPEATIINYVIELKAMTQGSGSFTREFLRYEEVPKEYIKDIIENNKK